MGAAQRQTDAEIDRDADRLRTQGRRRPAEERNAALFAAEVGGYIRFEVKLG
jgi:hypothetical protein